MNQLPKKLQKKIANRKECNSLRTLGDTGNLVDFVSNDYLGFSNFRRIFNRASEILKEVGLELNGATGSRLLSGNHALFERTETSVASSHHAEAALIFNSGYDANIGFFSSVPQRGDLIFYDELIHASIRDGIQMSHAKAYKFKHNDLHNLESVIERSKNGHEVVYIVTESVFSMDGDTPDLKALAAICSQNGYFLVVDEAHALGVMGEGKGLVQEYGVEEKVFARLVTFGKALGCHGAAILGSHALREYLINFARSFVYTTALPPHSVAAILASYEELENTQELKMLHSKIAILRLYINEYNLNTFFIPSNSAIHSCVIPGNDRVKEISAKLIRNGFDVKPILSPTVSEGQERLRFSLHSYNAERDIIRMLELLSTYLG